MPKLYQNIPTKEDLWQNPKKENSKFWNEGKWDNFIKPLLPEDVKDHTFVEVGCNAGLFLKLAEDHGYERVVGAEKDKTPVKEGLEYRNTIGYNYKILNRKMGIIDGEKGNFDINELPLADMTLLSTFHYYIDIRSWIDYVDDLRMKSREVIVVSRPNVVKRLWEALAQIDSVRHYFEGWQEVGMIENVDPTGDPHPRPLLYSVKFRNPYLKRIKIKDIIREPYGDNLSSRMIDMARDIAKSDDIDPFETVFYEKWRGRKEELWTEEKTKRFVKGKFDVMMDVKHNGLKKPILVHRGGKIADGGHRLAILEALGHESVIVRIV